MATNGGQLLTFANLWKFPPISRLMGSVGLWPLIWPSEGAVSDSLNLGGPFLRIISRLGHIGGWGGSYESVETDAIVLNDRLVRRMN